MSKLDDLYRLHRLLDGRRTPITRQALADRHACRARIETHLAAGKLA